MIVKIAVGVIVSYALGRYCWRQIKRVQQSKLYVSEAYRRSLLEREGPCYPEKGERP